MTEYGTPNPHPPRSLCVEDRWWSSCAAGGPHPPRRFVDGGAGGFLCPPQKVKCSLPPLRP